MEPEGKDYRHLFEFILRQLSVDKNEYDISFAILKKMCAFFSMDAAFAYLSVPAGSGLQMQVQIKNSENVYLPERIGIEELFSQTELRLFSAQGYENERSLELIEAKMAVRFAASKIAVLPLVDNDRLIGLIGVMTPDNRLAFSIEDKNAIKLVLSLIANTMKLGIYRQQVEFSRESLEKTIDHTGVDIYVSDFYTHEIFYANSSMAAPYGGIANLIGKKCYLALYDDKKAECDFCPKCQLIDEEGKPTKIYSWDYKRPFDGSWFRVLSAAFKWVDGRLAHVVTSVDITENKQNEYTIEKMAFYDALTDIPNRRNFERNFERVINDLAISGRTGYLVFVDLDNFKHINDAFGHAKGDELLRQVAAYLNGFLTDRHSAYRYGGDEFIVLLEKTELEEVVSITNNLLARFLQPWLLDDLEYFCTASMGVACFPKDGVNYDSLLHAADLAMYRAKKNGKSAVAFSMGEVTGRSEQLEKEFALRRAIVDGCKEFRLLFHPFVDAKTNLWSGAEVLIRWDSPQFGLIYPGEFIPICEKLGLISQLGKWILATALKQVSDWKLENGSSFFISFNISILDFQNVTFSKYLLDLLERFHFPPQSVMLELTESLQIYNVKEIKMSIDFLRKKGVLVALDGFGLGYASLERIRDLSGIDFIKVNRNFVKDCIGDELKTALVTVIAMLAHATRTRVCAEGVESETLRSALTEIGYDFLQGEYFQKPLPEAEFKKALANHRASNASKSASLQSA